MNNNEDIIEILDDIDDGENILPNLGPTPVNIAPAVQPTEVKEEYIELEKKLEEATYQPIEAEKQEITIETEEERDQSKSGLSFIIILFVLLAAFIIALPYITKLI